jgi:hypothetical protein
MDPRALIYHVDEEANQVTDTVSPSKILAWAVVVMTVAYAGIWLWQMAAADQAPLSSELVLGAVVAGGGALAYALYNRPGDLVDQAFQRTPGGEDG